jgi:hypothetical protein
MIESEASCDTGFQLNGGPEAWRRSPNVFHTFTSPEGAVSASTGNLFAMATAAAATDALFKKPLRELFIMMLPCPFPFSGRNAIVSPVSLCGELHSPQRFVHPPRVAAKTEF